VVRVWSPPTSVVWVLVDVGDVCLRGQGDLQPMAPEQWSRGVPLPLPCTLLPMRRCDALLVASTTSILFPADRREEGPCCACVWVPLLEPGAELRLVLPVL
jgi:hypothetical protein